MTHYLSVFTNRRIAAIVLLGFASGLPLALVSGTLQAWLTVSGVDLKTIGIFTLVGLPYTYKFLWAPLMDRYVPPFFGRRRGWLLLTQLVLIGLLVAMGMSPPQVSAWTLALLALAAAFVSASQDIVYDAYKTDVLPQDERGAGAAVSVMGYRIAMVVSGGVALIIADRYLGWSGMYFLMAGLMAIGIIGTLLAPEPAQAAPPPGSLLAAMREPFIEFFRRPGALALLALIVLYKLGDAFAASLSTAFLIRGAGFSATDVGAINKTLGLIATVGGALAGGALMAGLGLYRSLLLFGLLQAVSNLGFMALAMVGKSYPLMVAAVAVENICGGLGTAAFVALLMALCDLRFSATQYALLSALAAVGRVYVGPAAGFLVEGLGWPVFFLVTFAIALPGVGLLYLMRERLRQLEAPRGAAPVDD